ncbi:MAG: hypothetical protein ACR2ND_14305 [Solirubrobacteraceae bacterium]
MLKPVSATLLIGLAFAGCGGSASPSPGSGGSTASPSALAADAKSAATGDIPDNQNFLTYRDARLAFSIVYPEGWTVRRSAGGVSFQDKNNLVRIVLARGAAPTIASVRAQLAALRAVSAGATQATSLTSGPAIKATYSTQSAPNPVTGKRVTLQVDRYEIGHAGRLATVDLGTPTGVDNIDAYKRVVASFKWL